MSLLPGTLPRSISTAPSLVSPFPPVSIISVLFLWEPLGCIRITCLFISPVNWVSWSLSCWLWLTQYLTPRKAVHVYWIEYIFLEVTAAEDLENFRIIGYQIWKFPPSIARSPAPCSPSSKQGSTCLMAEFIFLQDNQRLTLKWPWKWSKTEDKQGRSLKKLGRS